MTAALLTLGRLAFRLGITPRPSDVADHRLMEVVEGPDRLPPGRALDVGTGTGRNARYLATRGWETTGVELDEHILRIARRHSSPVRWVHGDVTRLSELDIGTGYTLLMDGGCYHMIPEDRRDAYVHSVSAVAAPGAILIMVGFTKLLAFGMDREELEERFTGWDLLAADPVPGEQMHQYISGPAPLRAALRRGHFHPHRYQFRRRAQ
ncbi:MAG TPA: class I SAM-dependent methyltransferase [Actinophytocola sp.]|uniref:class I SAM-dependent methyltransferase n=1 Tax=Actinophytocola sp. TaxID=1872138 RepID=UPI002DDDA3D7|nr:class I SAM-dependent methyltransferase [Actinophytocola sp.]HEV2784004.1 class I SAM-dependent methyltransferase [Actinophytocola sp.]